MVIDADPDGGYCGCTIELPLVFGTGGTIEACVKDLLEAQTVTVAYLLEIGERPPSPASEDKREVQVNIRLTANEKLLIDEAARRTGFRSISDFIRTASLRHAS